MQGIAGRFALSRPRLLLPGPTGVALCVFVACLLGIFSRPLDYLAAFWPANAVMLGLLLRHPVLAARPLTWLLCAVAFVSADLLTGSSWFMALGMNGANLAGIAAAWIYLSRKQWKLLNFQDQRSVMHLLAGSVIASLACTLVGAPVGAVAFGTPLTHSAASWLASELYSYLLVTPIILAAPTRLGREMLSPLVNWRASLPLLTLVGSECLSLLIGGPGALGFVMPAMVWCAMAYGVFPVAVLNLLLCSWKMAAMSMGALDFTLVHLWELVSFRSGLALLSLAPLAVACAYALRLTALENLHQAVNFDYLTGALTRRALVERGARLVSQLQESGTPFSVAMLDVDHFKRINDVHGHAQGDLVLKQLAQLVARLLRRDDLFGRLGGEEFAMILPGATRETSMIVAQRIREQLGNTLFTADGVDKVRVTLSIGMVSVAGRAATAPPGTADVLEKLLSKADAALYEAKAQGRDRVRHAESEPGAGKPTSRRQDGTGKN